MPRQPRRGRRADDEYDEHGYLSGNGDDGDATQQIDYPQYADAGYDDRYQDEYADAGPAGYDDREEYAQGGYADGYDDRDEYTRGGYPDDYDEPQPARGGRGRGRGGPPGGRPPRRRRPRYGLRRFMVVVLVLLLAYVAAMVWAISATWSSIERVPATPGSAERPEGGAGTNFVLVGTDSRENLTREERNDLVAGHGTEGARADTVMLLHLPDNGAPTLVSIPRDSYVEIPGEGSNKINAAYASGGPALLVDTVEQSTGLRVDGYLEIGFGGFVEVVRIAGGVHMCLDEPVQDEKTKLDLPAGCQDLEGAEALNYVRMRYSDPRGDLGRVERQREFLAALVNKMATPQTLLVPWRLHDVGTATGEAMAIGEDTSMWETGRMALAMRSISNGSGQSVTVPIENANYSTPVGSAVLWDEAESQAMFEALRNGEPISVEP
jgi:LCP family protein required for cell wall assembly